MYGLMRLNSGGMKLPASVTVNIFSHVITGGAVAWENEHQFIFFLISVSKDRELQHDKLHFEDLGIIGHILESDIVLLVW